VKKNLTPRRKAAKDTKRFFLAFLCVFAPWREVSLYSLARVADIARAL